MTRHFSTRGHNFRPQGVATFGGNDTFSIGKIEKVPRGIRGEKSSKDMASSRNMVSTMGALASPKMRDDKMTPLAVEN